MPPSVNSDGDPRVQGSVPALRILVVDDSRDSADSMASLLRHYGHVSLVAPDGRRALQLGAQFRPDAILLDIGLPEVNGYEVARQIREEPWGRSIALFALTGWGRDEDCARSREAGFHAHLVKPVDPGQLLRRLAEVGASLPAPLPARSSDPAREVG